MVPPLAFHCHATYVLELSLTYLASLSILPSLTVKPSESIALTPPSCAVVVTLSPKPSLSVLLGDKDLLTLLSTPLEVSNTTWSKPLPPVFLHLTQTQSGCKSELPSLVMSCVVALSPDHKAV